ncbi:MAG: type II toxin-antitoxin system RelE/ParE family toxin [Syntrophomonadaceae bacterium]|nr:type II toxin-antitoxin system RelE/ParE family toxin [Syntrophomonadaceae bacterium]
MGSEIRFNPLANTDLQEIKEYIAEDNPDAAIKTIRDIITKIEELNAFPHMGPLLSARIKQKSKYRYMVCGQYLVFYFCEDNIVSVQRVMHVKRNYAVLFLDDNFI